MNETEEILSPNKEENKQELFKVQFAHFLVPTGKQYVKSSLSYLSDRNIENRLLDNLLEFLPEGVVIAGGFPLNVINEEKKSNDIDFFFLNQKSFDDLVNLLKNPPEEAWAYQNYTRKEEKNDRYVSFEKPDMPNYQLINMVWYDSPEHVIDTFDFTVAQFAFTGKEFVYNGEAMMDLARKRLVLHRLQFPASTLRRLIKYTHKGYFACQGSLIKITEAIQAFNGSPDINQVVYLD